MKKLLIPLAAIAIISCSKDQGIGHPECHRVYSISEKYYNLTDKTPFQVDSLWPWGRQANYFCDAATLNKYSNLKDSIFLCPDNTYEKRYYIVK